MFNGYRGSDCEDAGVPRRMAAMAAEYRGCTSCHCALSSSELDEPGAYGTKRSQKEKNKRHLLTHVESRKMVLMNLFAGRAGIETQIRRRNAGHSTGMRGWNKFRE